MLWSRKGSRVRLGLDRDLKGGGSSPCGHPEKILSRRSDEGRAAKQSALGQRTGEVKKAEGWLVFNRSFIKLFAIWWAILTSISSYSPSVKSSQVALGSDSDAVNYSFLVFCCCFVFIGLRL